MVINFLFALYISYSLCSQQTPLELGFLPGSVKQLFISHKLVGVVIVFYGILFRRHRDIKSALERSKFQTDSSLLSV